MSAAKKVLKPIKKLPKTILKLPQKIAKAVVGLIKTIIRLASKAQIFSLRTVSGKVFLVFQVLVVVDILFGLSYGVGAWQRFDLITSVVDALLWYAIGATLVFAGLFLVTYPLDKRGAIRATLVKSGIRQRSRMTPSHIAIGIGLVFALVFTVLVSDWVLGITLASFSLLDALAILSLLLLSFLASTALVVKYLVYENSHYVRESLTIVSVTDNDDETQSVVLRNDGDLPVQLWGAKLADSRGNQYRLEKDVRFRPGDRRSFRIPEGFDIETTDYKVPTGLGLLYDDERATTVYDRTGDMFLLEWEG